MSIVKHLEAPIFRREVSVDICHAWKEAFDRLEAAIHKDQRRNRKEWRAFDADQLYTHAGLGAALTSADLSVDAFVMTNMALFDGSAVRLTLDLRCDFFALLRKHLRRDDDPPYKRKLEFLAECLAKAEEAAQ